MEHKLERVSDRQLGRESTFNTSFSKEKAFDSSGSRAPQHSKTHSRCSSDPTYLGRSFKVTRKHLSDEARNTFNTNEIASCDDKNTAGEFKCVVPTLVKLDESSPDNTTSLADINAATLCGMPR